MTVITNRYGIKLSDGSFAAYGTNNVKLARFYAKKWNGKVVDLAAFGKRLQKTGTQVHYSYRR